MLLPYTVAVQHVHPESGSCAHRLQRCRLDAVNRRITVNIKSAADGSCAIEQVCTAPVCILNNIMLSYHLSLLVLIEY